MKLFKSALEVCLKDSDAVTFSMAEAAAPESPPHTDFAEMVLFLSSLKQADAASTVSMEIKATFKGDLLIFTKVSTVGMSYLEVRFSSGVRAAFFRLGSCRQFNSPLDA
ncbi:hypothetical protein [Streptomyces megasporus]|uniref:hypothetical protein n=1 Tax=Streptomyces megasporus TaxID=44060 RepID=UPI0012FE7FF7|nr:hypothetical protein [Streptomyces megasporus]